ncbi:hypothetical protein PLESTB_001339600 [Pleodorina starrii]|uniref:Uncharacterized protein n=1 Tax=Pleodorina starrii TaxID=330485 RepID=A0A9W6BVI3_9CHLO|nr:hypothetical protein PLESTB_001339600 [Pleodorina starrii]GLC66386.1 hypothetical protein PLESTF_000421800 [Pleodorina starrii]
MAPKTAAAAKAAPTQQFPAGAGRALITILIFSALMVTCPFILYFGSYEGYFDKMYALTIGIPAPENRAVASAILAVLGVNLVVGSFIFVAFREAAAAAACKGGGHTAGAEVRVGGGAARTARRWTTTRPGLGDVAPRRLATSIICIT